jgi:hypothetical protein
VEVEANGGTSNEGGGQSGEPPVSASAP